MINDFLTQQIKENFPYQPTSEQDFAVKMLSDFMFSKDENNVFILSGYAGTGKTSLVGALVRTLDQLKQKVILLSPTGRAAKVFAHYAGHPAYTIHKRIYRQRSFSNEISNFSLNNNLSKDTLYIVDEASMISNQGLSGNSFGSGRLLDDLVQYVYGGDGCRLLLIGDDAQLPPVGEELSPALFPDALRCYGLNVFECALTQVVRQDQSSGVLYNATVLRRLLNDGDTFSLPKIKVSGFADICHLPGNELIEKLEACYNSDGLEETIVLTRSNKRANIYNNGIRSQILWRECEIESGDLIMVAKNNYFWTTDIQEMDFIANGEIAEVRRTNNERELYGFHFIDLTLSFPDHGDLELDATLLLEVLHSETPALPKDDNDKLFYTILEDYQDVTRKADRMKKMKEDTYYNALQAKYAYAVTCHKAQGGQWKNVFLDQGYMTDEYLTPDYFRWLYTAFTRTTGTLYLVNYPQNQLE